MTGDEFKFTRLDVTPAGRPVVTTVKTIKRSDVAACPHLIIVPEHYRQSGVCRCTDPDHTEMADWGYVWNGRRWA